MTDIYFSIAVILLGQNSSKIKINGKLVKLEMLPVKKVNSA
jgi:hypothetical protein